MKNKERARSLRQNATDAEKLLWRHLRNRQLSGFKFRRQMPVEPYIVDFACLEAKLIIELDGGQHAEQQTYDQNRSRVLGSRGYRVLRFWNNEMLRDMDAVLERIRMVLLDAPHPGPLPEGEGDKARGPVPEGEGENGGGGTWS
uniref:Very-short-patch-repair endonuclease n=1 Tax=Candidatus Kentrum sp. LFY TaxID=2126342 RepID=A0A450UVW5_9GAMM|nr:MAG: Very-short-patch-repair endonuclease [Candidatus Kentron sp. LFY]